MTTRRLLPPALCPDNHTHSVEVFSLYLRATKDLDRKLLVNAVCSVSGVRKTDDPVQKPTVRSKPAEQEIQSIAAMPENTDHAQAENKGNDYPDYAETSSADVIMLINAAIASLPKERDRCVLEMRLGAGEQPLTLAGIGTKWGISRERVRQIQERAFRRFGGQSRKEGTPGFALKNLLEATCTSLETLAIWLLNAIHSNFVIPRVLAVKFILRTAGYSDIKVTEIFALLPRIARKEKNRLRELDRSHAASQRVESVINGW